MTPWHVTSYAEAVAGLRDRAAELTDVPLRLHDHAIGDDGVRRLSPAFLRYLTGSVHASHPITVTVVCPARHETGRPCEQCSDLGSWTTTSDVYDRPLSRALCLAAQRSLKLRPHPVVLVDALIAEDFDLRRAARRVGIVIVSEDQIKTEEARFLSAIRTVHGLFEVTVLRLQRRQRAEDAA